MKHKNDVTKMSLRGGMGVAMTYYGIQRTSYLLECQTVWQLYATTSQSYLWLPHMARTVLSRRSQILVKIAYTQDERSSQGFSLAQ